MLLHVNNVHEKSLGITAQLRVLYSDEARSLNRWQRALDLNFVIIDHSSRQQIGHLPRPKFIPQNLGRFLLFCYRSPKNLLNYRHRLNFSLYSSFLVLHSHSPINCSLSPFLCSLFSVLYSLLPFSFSLFPFSFFLFPFSFFLFPFSLFPFPIPHSPFPAPRSLFSVPCILVFVLCSLFPTLCSLFPSRRSLLLLPVLYSLFPVLCFLFFVLCSLFPVLHSLFPVPCFLLPFPCSPFSNNVFELRNNIKIAITMSKVFTFISLTKTESSEPLQKVKRIKAKR